MKMNKNKNEKFDILRLFTFLQEVQLLVGTFSQSPVHNIDYPTIINHTQSERVRMRMKVRESESESERARMRK
jgi:hypothetical protein